MMLLDALGDRLFPSVEFEGKSHCVRKCVRLALSGLGLSNDVIEQIGYGVLKREQLGSTGIGRGFAFPHGKANQIDRIAAGLFVAREPVPFDAIDDKPVDVIFCFVSLQDRPGDHLRLSEDAVRLLRDDAVVQSVRQAATTQEMSDVVRKAWESSRMR
jgi:PTS system fructose-specific IIA component/PTS system nitrogen regulatory IIA component